MITLGIMKWSNCFSYGENNEIDFSANPLTQIVGLNGHGKSSIALILEEVLYNKNSKGIKKSDILNRNLQGKSKASSSYTIELSFIKNGSTYYIKTVRTTVASVKFFIDGVDISAHTATATYKLIEETIGFDHKTFAQIVYQSSAAGLELLTATDSNRKKFLIDLLNLSKYVEAADVFKAAAKEVNEQVIILTTKVTSNNNWIEKYQNTDTTTKTLLDVPETPREVVEEIAELTAKVKSIETDNKLVVKNNSYKAILDTLVIESDVPRSEVDLTANMLEQAAIKTKITEAKALITKIEKAGAACPVCKHKVELPQAEEIIANAIEEKAACTKILVSLEKVAKEAKEINSRADKVASIRKEYEEYHALYNSEVSTVITDKASVEAMIKEMEANILVTTKEIKRITDSNNLATAHNAKIDVILTQVQDMQTESIGLKAELLEVSARLGILNVLVKTFSATGLVAYKIECLIKDLENITNGYLNEISSGRFQISFKIASADKLNVVITDNGIDIDILALSGGERARVNTATLLGIRKLMQSMSNARINLLILDETIESLDVEGKEKLVETLLSEEHLNTFIVSHGFTHPLLEKINVVKTNNISRIE